MHVYVMHIECAKGAFQLDRKKGLIYSSSSQPFFPPGRTMVYSYTHDLYSLHTFAACM